MKPKISLLIVGIFLAFLVLSINVKASILFQDIQDISIPYSNIYHTSDAYSVSNIISYDNKIEIIYSTASSGIKNVVLTNTSGSWSSSTYTVTPSYETNKKLSLIQNDTDIHGFFRYRSDGTNIIFHYKRIKGTSIWTYVNNKTYYTGTELIGCYFQDNNLNISCFAVVFNTVTRIRFNPDGSVTTTGYHLGTDEDTFVKKSNVTSNAHMIAGWDCGTGYVEFGMGKYFQEPSTGHKEGCIKTGQVGYYNMFLPSFQYDYVMSYNLINESFWYIFDTNNTYDISCSPTIDDIWYYCYENFPFSSPLYTLTFYRIIEDYDEMIYDIYNNLHIIYFGYDDGTNVKFSRIFQSYGNKTKWYAHNITTSNKANLHGYGLTNFADGSIFMKTENGEIDVFYEGVSSNYYAPPPPSPADEDALGIICDVASVLTGSPREGGCLIVSLFAIAIAVSIIGVTFRYYEWKLRKQTPNKYIITGGVIVIMITMFMFVGMVDYLTGLVSIFVLIALMLVYQDRSDNGL